MVIEVKYTLNIMDGEWCTEKIISGVRYRMEIYPRTLRITSCNLHKFMELIKKHNYKVINLDYLNEGIACDDHLINNGIIPIPFSWKGEKVEYCEIMGEKRE